MWKYILISIFLIISASGCSDSSSSGAPGSTISSYAIIGSSDGFTTSSLSQISGSGQILFAAPADEVSAGHDFAFQISVADGGSIVFHLFSSSSLLGGVNLTLTRSGASYLCSLEINSNSTSCTAAVASLDATASIPLYVDVHNDEDPTHVLFWSGNSFAEDDALFNTEEDFGGLGPGDKATGTAWGLTLTDATITRASLGEPLFEEE